jgi:hypothetical protein
MTQGDDLLAKKLQNSRKKQLAMSGASASSPSDTKPGSAVISDSNFRKAQSQQSLPSAVERVMSDRTLPKISSTRGRRPKKPWDIPEYVDNLIAEGRTKDIEEDNFRKSAFLENRELLRQTFHLRKTKRKELERRCKTTPDRTTTNQDFDKAHLIRIKENEDIYQKLMTHRQYEVSKLAEKTRSRELLEMLSNPLRKGYSPSRRIPQFLPEFQETTIFDDNLPAVQELDTVFVHRLNECLEARFSGKRKIPSFDLSTNHRNLTQMVFTTPLYN